MHEKLARRTFIVGGAALLASPAVIARAADGLSPEEFGLVRAINLMRKERGLKPLALRADLSEVARAYARRMAKEGFFDHISPEGEGPTERAEEAGYDWRRLGETLAAGFKTPEKAAESWRDSPGHAAIIFDPENRHVGVGFWRRNGEDDEEPRPEEYWTLLAGDTR